MSDGSDSESIRILHDESDDVLEVLSSDEERDESVELVDLCGDDSVDQLKCERESDDELKCEREDQLKCERESDDELKCDSVVSSDGEFVVSSDDESGHLKRDREDSESVVSSDDDVVSIDDDDVSLDDIDDEEEEEGLLEETVFTSEYQRAVALLRSSDAGQMPGREKEVAAVREFVTATMSSATSSRGLLVAGVPGTGKTSAVQCALKGLDGLDFDVLFVNAMKLREPRRIYSLLAAKLWGGVSAPGKALARLKEHYSRGGDERPLLVVVDELDELIGRPAQQAILYNVFDWASGSSSRLAVVGIANTIDLLGRLGPKIASRVGTRSLTFRAYQRAEIQAIVEARLAGVAVFSPDVLKAVAMKVSGLNGDVRRAFDICCRAAELAEQDGGADGVLIEHVNRAEQEMFHSPELRLVDSCSLVERLLLSALLLEMRASGQQSVAAADVYQRHCQLAAVGAAALRFERFVAAAHGLAEAGLISCSPAPHLRLALLAPGPSVDVDDMHALLRQCPDIVWPSSSSSSSSSSRSGD